MSRRAPVYEPLVNALREQILTGKIGPGFLGTEIGLALGNGISRNSAREAISILAREGLVERRGGKGIFVREQASGLVMEMIVPSLSDAWGGRLLDGAGAAAREKRAKLQIFSADGNFEEDLRAVRRLPMMKVSGAIVVSVHHVRLSQQVIELHQGGFPVVLVDQRLRDVDVPSVTFDDIQGGYLAATQLLDQGHRRIGFVGYGYEDGLPSGRQEGYRRALGDRGIALDRSLEVLYPYASIAGPLAGERDEPIARLLTRADPPTAIMAQNGGVAVECLQLIDARGMSDRFSVITFSPRREMEKADPRLSYIELPDYELGLEAVRLLFERITLPHQPARHAVVPMKLGARAA